MLLLSSPQNRRPRRASLLLLAAVLLSLILSNACASLPASSKCPRLDCAKEGRNFCKAGTSHCGPCLSPLEENEEGRCVVKKRHHPTHAKTAFYPDVEEEIDYIHSFIEKQDVSPVKPPKKQSKQPAAISLQTDVNKNKPDAPKQKQKSQSQPLTESQHITNTTPQHTVSGHHPTPTANTKATGADGHVGPIAVPAPRKDTILVIMISLCITVGTVAVIMATVCFVRLQKESRLAQKVDYPAFGGKGKPAATANSTSMGDKTLAQNAQMYHYQHQKQQMLSLGKHKPEQKSLDTEITSDEDEVGGDFTVYECPGLAPTGEMEVKNPLFDDSNMHYQGNHK